MCIRDRARRAAERRVRMRGVRVDEEVEAGMRPQDGLGDLLLVLEAPGLGRDVAGHAAVDALAPEEVHIVVEAVELDLLDLEGRGEHCLLYTSDAADEEDSVDLGGRRIIKK